MQFEMHTLRFYLLGQSYRYIHYRDGSTKDTEIRSFLCNVDVIYVYYNFFQARFQIEKLKTIPF